ncbi:MAG: AAA family ATPase [Dokdonella sp.]
MYLEHYGLNEAPFSITPDPRYVFLSERHRDALAHLLYGIGKGGSGGFIQLTGEVGTGKTTLCRLLLDQLPDDTRVALVLNPKLSPVELVESICEELKLDVKEQRGSLKGLTDKLNAFLLDAYAEGLRVVLIVDEAQNLSTEALEQIRLLTNLETPTQKLLQIILLGQPELRDMLDRPELRQLAQRITARYHLTPLDSEETEAYVRHRLAVAGCTRSPFTRLGLKALFRRSGGVPRLINVIADRSLMAGYAHEEDSIGERLVERAANETIPGNRHYWYHRYRAWLLALLGLAVIAAVASLAWRWHVQQLAVPAAQPVAVEPAQPDPTLALLGTAIERSRNSEFAAFGELLARWQVDAQQVTVRNAIRCPAQLATGIACLRGRATLEQLARFDRPLVMQLAQGELRAYALLRGVGPNKLRINLGGSNYDLDRADLDQFWAGDFIVLWRLPDYVPAKLKRGDSGPAVAWVNSRLASLNEPGAELRVSDDSFDAALEERIRNLQTTFGVKADGIIGPETLFALAALDETGPHLTRVVQ